ncbi:MAG: DUF4328 domain-containing protein [Proteobacteria bacterium]|nr:DUF4328 domain-containing protein [Pseudomonadota bacterium]
MNHPQNEVTSARRQSPPRPGRRSQATIALLVANILAGLGYLLFIALEMGKLRRGEPNFYMTPEEITPDLAAYSLVVLLFGLLIIVLAVTLVVFFCLWLHRAYRVFRDRSAGPVRFTPAWAVGWNFIPIFWWWKPYQVFREMWRGSSLRGPSEPPETPWLIIWWWVICLVVWAEMLASIVLNLTAKTLADYLIVAGLDMAGTIITLAAYLLSIVVISRLTRRLLALPVTLPDTVPASPIESPKSQAERPSTESLDPSGRAGD